MKPVIKAVRPVGLASWLVEVDDPAHAVPLSRFLGERKAAGELPGVVDVVPGAATVLLDAGERGPDRASLLRLLSGWDPRHHPQEPSGVVEVPVVYDGADLDSVAELAGTDRRGVVARHTGAQFTVAFCGFSAGFAYITGLPGELRLPRLETPRTVVPAGSVAIAESWTGVYPRASPGGWRLIGRTDVVLWDATRSPPALLGPGTRVRFREA